MSQVRLILGSASLARLRLLRSAGLHPEVMVSEVDEPALAPRFSTVGALALGLATAKADDVAARLVLDGRRTLVLGCDSVLEFVSVPELVGRALGKPADAAEAGAWWRLMRGRVGALRTGHCLLDPDSGARRLGLATTRVSFATPTDAEIAAYVATGEPLGVAGAFTLDGLGGAFIAGIDGDPSNVIGVSLPMLRDLMAQHGVAWPDLWRAPVESGTADSGYPE